MGHKKQARALKTWRITEKDSSSSSFEAKQRNKKDSNLVPDIPGYLKELQQVQNPFRRADELGSQTQKPAENTGFMGSRDKSVRMQPIGFKWGYTVEQVLAKNKYKPDINPKRKSFVKSSDSSDAAVLSKRCYVDKKRAKCLTNLAMVNKLEVAFDLEDLIEEENSDIECKEKKLRNDTLSADFQLRKSCRKTTKLMKQADDVTRKEEELSKKLKRLRTRAAHLNTDCLRQEEILYRLLSYKNFIDSCSALATGIQIVDAVSLEEMSKVSQEEDETREQLTNEATGRDVSSLVPNILVTEASKTNWREEETNTFSSGRKLSETNTNAEPEVTTLNTFSNSNIATEEVPSAIVSQTGLIGSMLGRVGDSEDLLAECLNEDNARNQKLVEHPGSIRKVVIPFEHPEELVELLKNLERNNLTMIEFVQGEEEMCEDISREITRIENIIQKESKAFEKTLISEELGLLSLEKDINFIKKKINRINDVSSGLRRFSSFFYFPEEMIDLTIPKVMQVLHDLVEQMYLHFFQNQEGNRKISMLMMLRRLEIELDDNYLRLFEHSKEQLLRARTIVAKQNRANKRQMQKERNAQSRQEKLARVIEKSNQSVRRTSTGRRVVQRSQPPMKSTVENVVDEDTARAIEEHRYFFLVEN